GRSDRCWRQTRCCARIPGSWRGLPGGALPLEKHAGEHASTRWTPARGALSLIQAATAEIGMPSSRVDYDSIADGYDSQPHRGKSPDPDLMAFIGERGS